MAGTTKIEWTQKTWNPVRGCSRISEGCRNCYAEKIAARFGGCKESGGYGSSLVLEGLPFFGFVDTDGRWNGRVELVESMLDGPGTPLRTRKPATWFVNSMSDLFHHALPEGDIRRVFRAIQQCQHHTFQILTKRAERMAEIMPGVLEWLAHFAPVGQGYDQRWNASPIPNAWLGVSVENQAAADKRIPLLLQTPAAVRFISAEPLLGAVDLSRYLYRTAVLDSYHGDGIAYYKPRLDWVIVGGESGPGARPMHPDWARSVRDQCVAAGVPFFFKQWGEWIPSGSGDASHLREGHRIKDNSVGPDRLIWLYPDGSSDPCGEGDAGRGHLMMRAGKRNADRSLDGRTWDQMPEVAR
jgi:protein gp37